MDGGTRHPKNPDRVPSILSAIDQPAEGLPRVIHPVGIAVGRPDAAAATTGVLNMDPESEGVRIDADVTYTNDAGTPFRFRAGDVISAGRAASFPELREYLYGAGGGLARGADERPDVAATDDPEAPMSPNPITRRMVPGAPENRMDNRRDNRSEDRGDEGYNAQNVAALRALAKSRGVTLDSDARKAEIVAALETADAGTGSGASEGE